MRKAIILMTAALLIAQPVLADETETETEITYTETDLWYLSRVIQAEAGYTYVEMMEDVGSVVLNRVASDKFPNSIQEVIEEPGQYATASYLANHEPTEEVMTVAIDLLEHGSKLPGDVIYQANVILGPVYKQLSTSYSVMYFCTGG